MPIIGIARAGWQLWEDLLICEIAGGTEKDEGIGTVVFHLDPPNLRLIILPNHAADFVDAKVCNEVASGPWSAPSSTSVFGETLTRP